MTEQITAERAIELLELVVAREGRDIRRPCRYVNMGHDTLHPVCLIGYVMAEAGVPLETMAYWNSKTISEVFDNGTLNGVVDVSTEAVDVLQVAQDMQDIDKTWGAALDAALIVARRNRADDDD